MPFKNIIHLLLKMLQNYIHHHCFYVIQDGFIIWPESCTDIYIYKYKNKICKSHKPLNHSD